MSVPVVRVHIGPCRAGFRPRAAWVLGIMWAPWGARCSSRTVPRTWCTRRRAGEGSLDPGRSAARKSFFTIHSLFHKTSLSCARSAKLFGPCVPSAAIDADIVASAFHFLVRWDEYCVDTRDRFGRLPFGSSTFGQVAGLDPLDPPVERYIGLIADALGFDRPTGWQVYLTNDIDDLRMRTPRS